MAILEPKTREEFDTAVREAKGPVVVDFTAAGCGACSPEALDKLAKDCPTAATIIRVETTEGFGDTLATEFNVEGTPTTLLADNGAEFTPEGAVEVNPESKAVRRRLKCAR